MEAEAIVEPRIAASRCAENVCRQTSVPGRGFDDVERVNLQVATRRLPLVPCEQAGHFGKLAFEELAEHRADIDAGKKIARAPRSFSRAGVVPGLRVAARAL